MNTELLLKGDLGASLLPGSKMIVNCTPHSIEIWNDDGAILEIKSEEFPARCRMNTRHLADFRIENGGSEEKSDFSIPLFGITEESDMVTENLPSPREGVMYVVSKIVASANPDREDLLLVWNTVRDERGSVIGCRGLSLP